MEFLDPGNFRKGSSCHIGPRQKMSKRGILGGQSSNFSALTLREWQLSHCSNMLACSKIQNYLGISYHLV